MDTIKHHPAAAIVINFVAISLKKCADAFITIHLQNGYHKRFFDVDGTNPSINAGC